MLSSAIKSFLSEHKGSPRHLQAVMIQLDRCFARNSEMATKPIMGFCEGQCGVSLSYPTNGGVGFVCYRIQPFIIERALAIIQQCNDHTDKCLIERSHC